MRLRRLAQAILALASLGAWLLRPTFACELTPRATVPLRVIASRLLVEVTVNGVPATFQLDTGAGRSLITPEAAKRLRLTRDSWVGISVWGIGGIERNSVADPRSLTLAGIPLRHRTPAADATLAVGLLSADHAGDVPIEGLLGRDFLSAFDVALDVPGRTLTLWSVNGCAGRFLPWREPYDAIAALAEYGDALVLPVLADGERLRALPATGAAETLLGVPGVIRLGLGPFDGPAQQAHGVGTRARPVWPVRLSSLQVGDQTAHDVPVLASRLRFYPIVDMLLGADWFRARRVWLSYATRQVFVSRP
jgi:hypothetical protein